MNLSRLNKPRAQLISRDPLLLPIPPRCWNSNRVMRNDDGDESARRERDHFNERAMQQAGRARRLRFFVQGSDGRLGEVTARRGREKIRLRGWKNNSCYP